MIRKLSLRRNSVVCSHAEEPCAVWRVAYCEPPGYSCRFVGLLGIIYLIRTFRPAKVLLFFHIRKVFAKKVQKKYTSIPEMRTLPHQNSTFRPHFCTKFSKTLGFVNFLPYLCTRFRRTSLARFLHDSCMILARLLYDCCMIKHTSSTKHRY